MATTRLDRLLQLVESGTTPARRNAAAKQVGEVVRQHPQDLQQLLARTHTILRSNDWKARMSAGKAIDAIARAVPPWNPAVSPQQHDATAVAAADERAAADAGADGLFSFETFDIERVLTRGAALVGSKGHEYDLDDAHFSKLDPRERLRQQRRELAGQLGLTEESGMKTVGSLIGATDLGDAGGGESGGHAPTSSTTATAGSKRKRAGEAAAAAAAAATVKEEECQEEQQAAAAEIRDELAGLSARERQRAKRQARLAAKKRGRRRPVQTYESNSGSGGAAAAVTGVAVTDQGAAAGGKVVVEAKVDALAYFATADEWPFQARCEELCNDLFSPMWEERHGAAVGLRVILKTHGSGAGRVAGTSAARQDVDNARWLDDIAIRLACVVALDRYGDFAAAQVVAPVREMCAQALAASMQAAPYDSVANMLRLLLRLEQDEAWEVRHGGLLGVMYLLGVRADLTKRLLPELLPIITKGLRDREDDVRAASAAAFMPVTDCVVENAPDKLRAIMTICWDAMFDLDDLTASTSSVLELLTSLLQHIVRLEGDQGVTHLHTDNVPLEELVSRLWPFFRHPLVTVRRAALETFRKIFNCSLSAGVTDWLPPILPQALTHIFQNALLEEDTSLVSLTREVWAAVLRGTPARTLFKAAAPRFVAWFSIMITPAGATMDPRHVMVPRQDQQIYAGGRSSSSGSGGDESSTVSPAAKRAKEGEEDVLGEAGSVLPAQKRSEPQPLVVGGASQALVPDMAVVMKARLEAARLVGELAGRLTLNSEDAVSPKAMYSLLTQMLKPNAATKRQLAGVIVAEWLQLARDSTQQQKQQQQQPPAFDDALVARLLAVLEERVSFLELEDTVRTMRADVRAVLAAYTEAGVADDLIASVGKARNFSADAALSLVDKEVHGWEASISDDAFFSQDALRERSVLCGRVRQRVEFIGSEYERLHLSMTASLAGAVIALQRLPPKLNPIIRPLMGSLRREENELLQQRAGAALSHLLDQLRGREKNPGPKIAKNVAAMVSKDVRLTPQIDVPGNADAEGVLTLRLQADAEERAAAAKRKRRGGKSAAAAVATTTVGDSKESSAVAIGGAALSIDPEEAAAASRAADVLEQRGGVCGVRAMARHFGATLFEAVPIWTLVTEPLAQLAPDAGAAVVQEAINAIQILETLGPALHIELMPHVLAQLPVLLGALCFPSVSIRYKAAVCLAELAAIPVATEACLIAIITNVIPRLGDTTDNIARQGAAEALYHLVSRLDLAVLPYIVILVIPILGRLSDFDSGVRKIVSRTFAQLMRLMPLEATATDPAGMPEHLKRQKVRDRAFLEQLMDPTKLMQYKMPVPIKASLRSYQQAGLDWMRFLNTYQLHGILCDDMGLGKTLQSICIMAADKHERATKYAETGSADAAHLPSLVVCPTTLTDHWFYEVQKFCDSLRPVVYKGPPAERQKLVPDFGKYDVIVLSYEVLRNDIKHFAPLRFNYCILDEGHIIKNPKSRISLACKAVQSNHRLILSGTPIQNNVLELWSLFDFLMPGFLGSEQQFQSTYSKPIQASKGEKASQSDQEAGTLALEALHRQVLPFLLRRLKEDVLADLPPKIIQDYYCTLSPLQLKLYRSFSDKQRPAMASGLGKLATSGGGSGGGEAPTTTSGKAAAGGMFRALQYLQSVCNHPTLALRPGDEERARVERELAAQGSSLQDLKHAAKLTALMQLLLDCGIGVTMSAEKGDAVLAEGGVVGSHRVLLFAQHKAMLDVVERDVLGSHMPSVTYLRMDGGTPASRRHRIVTDFNDDPSIDLLLLTTHVGGLGLNLTGADTVIFLEHDWNPMKDLQAMDRAHRIGQKRVVNVYRIITRGTMEEKIMGLQKFKLNIANTVVSQENSSLASMGTDQLLDLFEVGANDGAEDGSSSGNDASAAAATATADSTVEDDGLQGVLQGLGELYDESNYEDYNLNSFLDGMKK